MQIENLKKQLKESGRQSEVTERYELQIQQVAKKNAALRSHEAELQASLKRHKAMVSRDLDLPFRNEEPSVEGGDGKFLSRAIR